jgi:hypothetical protein
MKITARNVGLLAVGFIMGAVAMVLLTTSPTRPPSAAPLGIVVTGPFLAATSLSPRFITITNVQWQGPPSHIVLPPRSIDSFDSQSPVYSPMRQPMHLIDTRYEPNIRLDDLK